MYFIYNLVLYSLLLLFSPIILIAMIIKPKFRAGFFQKTGFYGKIGKENKKNIWVHAVSVGEVNAVCNFIKKLREKYPNENIILSTVTKTGNFVAKKQLGDIVDHIVYFPFDTDFSVNSAIKAIKPDMVIIAETEIWPVFIINLKKKNIPCFIINGRISPHSYNGYKKFGFFFKNILNKYTKILMQTEDDAKRIIDIGAPKDIVQTMGNVKFDITNDLDKNIINTYKTEFQSENYKILLAGSTHKGEDEIILNCFKKLQEKDKNLKLILAPRHPERLNNVTNLLKEYNVKFSTRTQKGNFSDNDVILLDTMGELSKLYSIAYLAFIGGGFFSTGGHNPLESCIFNVPAISGDIVFNFKDIYALLTREKAAYTVKTEEELYAVCEKMLFDKEFYKNSKAACERVFENNRGAVDFALNKIDEVLS